MKKEELERLSRIEKQLAHIEVTLQRLPEIQAAVFFVMQEKAKIAEWKGQRVSELFDILPTNLR